MRLAYTIEGCKSGCVTKDIGLYSYVIKIHSFGPQTRPCLTFFGSVTWTRVYVLCVVQFNCAEKIVLWNLIVLLNCVV